MTVSRVDRPPIFLRAFTLRRIAAVCVCLALVALAVAVGMIATDSATRRSVLSPVTHRIGAPPPGPAHPGFSINNPPETRFAIVGDIGASDVDAARTAVIVDKLASQRPFDGLILLGDNVYPSGDPAMLDEVLFDPYGPVLDAGAQLLAVLGNHDCLDGNAVPQLQALGMPDRWYSREIGDVLFIGLDSILASAGNQVEWLEETLAASSARWKIAAMHHPPYSAGIHGSEKSVRAAFTPLFEKYGVQLVLSGHDHDYQRSLEQNGVTYVVSGGAATIRKTAKAEFTAAAWSTFHFVDLAVWDDRMELRAVDQYGRVFDEAVILP